MSGVSPAIYSSASCGVVPNTILLGVLAGVISTFLGLAFALLAQRGGLKNTRVFDALSVLPIITPPFVIALALVVLFGRTGIVTTFLDKLVQHPALTLDLWPAGVLIAQVLVADAALLHDPSRCLAGGISPSLEEAAQTLRASRWVTFRTVTWPLLRPAIAASILLGFVESLADFGNPLVLGGSFEVLSTKIFFAVAGAQHDPGRAAILAVILLALTLRLLDAARLARQEELRDCDRQGRFRPAPAAAQGRAHCYAFRCCSVGYPHDPHLRNHHRRGFVTDIGRGAMKPTFEHFHTGFAIEWTQHGLFLSGSAWDSFITTVQVSAIAAPLTTIIGILTAYVLVRHDFVGRRTFEFITMLAFAIPGTVIGVAYIVAFNVAPLELTGTGLILIICFVFRNMPVACAQASPR